MRMQTSIVPANIMQDATGKIILSGNWAARISGDIEKCIEIKLAAIGQLGASENTDLIIDGAQLENIDSAGVWILQRHLQKLRDMGKTIRLQGWLAHQQRLMETIKWKSIGRTRWSN